MSKKSIQNTWEKMRELHNLVYILLTYTVCQLRAPENGKW